MPKKVLLVSFRFQQSEMIGSIRLRGLAKYLPEFGWEPTVLTADLAEGPPSSCRVVATPFRSVIPFLKRVAGQDGNSGSGVGTRRGIRSAGPAARRRLKRAFQEIAYYPDFARGWREEAVRAGRDLLSREPFQAVISSSFPSTSHVVANRLKGEFGLPWIADLRDLWTQHHLYPYSRLRKAVETRFERKTLSRADRLVTVSRPWVERLAVLHGAGRISSIPNGFDPADLNEEAFESDVLTLVHTGTIYEGFQDVEPLLRAVRELIDEGAIDRRRIVIDICGRILRLGDPAAPATMATVEALGLKDNVILRGLRPREEALLRQRRCHVLFFLSWNAPGEEGVTPAKLFEYLAARRPILSVGRVGGGVVREILEATRAGVDLTEAAMIKSEVLTRYREVLASGRTVYGGVAAEIDRYSQREMARRFAGLLDTLAPVR